MPRFDFTEAEKEGLLFCVLSKRYGLYFEEKGSRWICNVDPSLNMFVSRKTGNWLVKDFGNRYPQFARAKGLQAVLTDLYGQDLQAKINDLAGCNYAPAQEWVDRENARNNSGSTAAQSVFACCPTAAVSDSPKYDGALLFDGSRTYGQDKKKEKATPEKPERQHVTTNWDSAQGVNVLVWLSQKTGVILNENTADFLTQYGIAPLRSTGGYTFPENGQNAGFIIRQNGWEKVRQTAPKDKQYKWQQYPAKDGAPYLFGFAQLPSYGENLFFLEGETDALAFAYHTGAPVLSLGSVGNWDKLPNDIAAELKARFKSIFVFWDADAAGSENGQKFADKHGFTFVDTAVMFAHAAKALGANADANDVCELYKSAEFGAVILKFISTIAPHTNGRISAFSDDVFSVPVPHVLQLPFDQYLSEGAGGNLNFVHSALSAHKKISLISPAGTGKSTMLALFSQECTAEKIIIAVPTITLAKQLAGELQQRLGACIGLVHGAMGEPELQEATAARVIVSVYDGVLKIRFLIPNSLFVVDEYHQLASERSYRKKAVRFVFRAAEKAQNLLLLSATPDYLLSEYLQTKTILCTPQTTNKIILRCVKTSTKRSQLAALIAEKERKTIAAGGTVGIKLDNINQLRGYKEYLENCGFTVEIFTSKDGEHENNENYKSIVETGYFKTAPNFLLFTTILEAGVSIKSPMPSIYILDKRDAGKIIQIANRPRYCADTGTNGLVTVTVFFSAKEKGQPQNGSTETAKKLSTKLYNNACAFVKKFSEQQRNGIAGTEKNRVTYADKDTFVYCHDAEKCDWRVDTLRILDYIRETANSAQTAELLCKRIARLDCRFQCEIVGWADYKNENAADIDKARKAEKKRATAEFARLVLAPPSSETLRILVLIAARKLKKDKAAQAELLAAFGFSLPSKTDANGKEELRKEIAIFAKANPIAFSGFCDLLGTVQRAAFYCAKGEKIDNAFATAVQTTRRAFRIEKDISAVKARKKAIKAKTADAKDLKNAEWVNDICAKISVHNRNLRAGRGRDFTAESIKDLVDGTLKAHNLPPTKSKNEAVNSLLPFYEIEKSTPKNKERKTVQIYTLTRRKE